MAETAAEPCRSRRASAPRAQRARSGAATRRRIGEAVAPLVVTVPVVRAVARSIRDGWVPIADEGIIALRAHDVWTSRTPALGQMSLASASAGAPTRSPGPLGYWVLSPAAQAGPLWLVPVVAGVVAVGALVATVVLARRRGGTGLAVAVAAALVLASRAVDPINHAVGWNPSIGLAPIALLVLLAWSVGVGERHRLPATIAVASFVAQLHVAYLLPATAAVAVAVGCGWGPEVLARVRGRGSALPVRPLMLGALAGLVLWSAPLLQQLLRRPGNLTLVARSAGGETHGWGFAGQVVAAHIGVPPNGARGAVGGLPLLARLLPPWPSGPTMSAAVVVAGLAGLVLVGVRRRSREIAVPPLLVLARLAAAAATLQATPTDARGVSVAYTSWWLLPVGLLAWVVLGTTALRALPVRLRVPPAVRTAVVVAVVGATAAVAVGTPIRDPEAHLYPVAEEVGDVVAAAVRPGGLYRVNALGTLGLQLTPGLAYRIRRAGADPVIPGGDGVSAGPEYVPQGRRCDAVVDVRTLAPGVPPPASRPGAEVLAVVEIPPGPAVEHRRAVVTWDADEGEPSC